jgi:transposase ISL3 family protein
MVPWARAGCSYTRDFEDVCAFLAQQMAKTPLSRLMRISWRSVGKILARVVADKLDHGRLDGLVMVGVDRADCQSGDGSGNGYNSNSQTCSNGPVNSSISQVVQDEYMRGPTESTVGGGP